MPRVLPTAFATPIKAEQTTKKGGSFLITSGWILLGVLAVDQGLQFLDRREAHQAVAELQRAEANVRRKFYEDWKDKPTLFETVVRCEYKVSDDVGYRKCGMTCVLGRRRLAHVVVTLSSTCCNSTLDKSLTHGLIVLHDPPSINYLDERSHGYSGRVAQ
jgi:hypothetical protein